MDEPNPYKAPTRTDRRRTALAARAAFRAALQASLLAGPVAVFGFYGTQETLPHRVRMHARVHVEPETVLHETIGLASMWLSVIGLWLGCAAYVGWQKSLAQSRAPSPGDRPAMPPPDEPPPV